MVGYEGKIDHPVDQLRSYRRGEDPENKSGQVPSSIHYLNKRLGKSVRSHNPSRELQLIPEAI